MISFVAKLFILFVLFIQPIYAEMPEFWQTITQPLGKVKDTQFLLRQQYRLLLDNLKTVDVRYSFESKTKLNKTFEAGLNFTWIHARHPDQNPFTQRYRWEFELNPHFKLSDSTELRIRNRYEIIKDEDESRLNQVFRQRQTLVMKTNLRSLSAISIYNEVFFNIKENRFDQNRLVPLELSFKIGREHVYRLYVMIRWLRPESTWNPQFILGSTLNW